MASTQVLAGFHAVVARLRHAPESIKEIYVEASRRDKRMQTLIEQAERAGRRVHPVPVERLDGLARGTRHQGVLAVADERQLAVGIDEVLDEIVGPAFLLILDGVTDPHNLGACLRTADAAGVHAVIAPRDRAVGLNSTVQRVACGAADTVPYITVTNLARTMRELKERGVWLVGTDDQASHDMHAIDARQPMAWVMGAEGEGMRRLTRETCDELVNIPMLGSVESLNVSVASAVCLYETVRQRRTQ
ncbi:23S rRNA (guanosine(2251)-2'-O)-methyltransferase RlmB [Bordetella avium]|uniref:23S rRNA (guanosine-2'-O-)-methyltransferase RlmB n=1 Tax=Bordetella avium (strain 197N) TaxID=360910 RepID=Q2KZB3_BORA1|nr:23S rRNA (guanosine(2251)-2'-O)-methyltransferase RlmB [Bordetella avium]AZY50928.1 23S rRNA (guanosine(2251)-2'-O)-methyltransferase RlmB [Bordetella avium]AZY52789.1 23S rRNA (guanosine(2251)-2'-O)-methyltransferase RlmB [Bordetella avium]RIQ12165.1 23S rRNA (guanosine(2251)-2'-O)-methyltransferase RlmB [Bordetella avium]RIQ31959.1 23S rRNA (guanosine(2251)-2'-O)-methyltransferase RlmB [Bordetella avium]RIQ38088.1 23S rRNA (guanosine(2251)-2'-O)-methyltransferase RlmB [Bordetella avium]